MASNLPLIVVQSPWAFSALLALAVPLVLHLISKSQAKLVKFANIELIDRLQPKNMRHIHLTEFWLLLLRILLLVVSILLLANVMITRPLISNETVFVVSPDWLNQSDDVERQQLVNKHLNKPIYLLARNTKLISADKILTWQRQENSTENKLTSPPQNILLHLDYFSQLLAPETEIKLFVTDRASQYQVNQLKTNIRLTNTIDWQIKNLVSQSQRHYNKAIKVLIVYDQDRYADLKYFQQALSLIKQQDAPKLLLSHWLNEGLENSVPYQQAMQEQPDWLFYLSSKQVGHHIVNAMTTGTNLFVDAENAKVNLMLSSVLSINQNSTYLLSAEAVFYQRALPLEVAKQLKGKKFTKRDEVLWQFTQQDGVKLPMLTKLTMNYHNEARENLVTENAPGKSSKQASYVYQLYSRFSPSWSNLLLTKQFPLFLQNLLFGQWQNDALAAQKTLTREQMSQLIYSPDHTESENAKSPQPKYKNAESAAFTKTTPLVITELKTAKALIVQQQDNADFWTELFVVLFILLWTLERILSEFFRPKMSIDSKRKNQRDDDVQVVNAQPVKSAKVVD
jgi:hypothetical protein